LAGVRRIDVPGAGGRHGVPLLVAGPPVGAPSEVVAIIAEDGEPVDLDALRVVHRRSFGADPHPVPHVADVVLLAGVAEEPGAFHMQGVLSLLGADGDLHLVLVNDAEVPRLAHDPAHDHHRRPFIDGPGLGPGQRRQQQSPERRQQ